MYNYSRNKGISPVIGVILLVAITVALIALATIIVFDTTDSSEIGNADTSGMYVQDSTEGIKATLTRESEADEYIVVHEESDTRKTLTEVGETVVLNEGSGTYSVIAITNGSEQLINSQKIDDDGNLEEDSNGASDDIVDFEPLSFADDDLIVIVANEPGTVSAFNLDQQSIWQDTDVENVNSITVSENGDKVYMASGEDIIQKDIATNTNEWTISEAIPGNAEYIETVYRNTELIVASGSNLVTMYNTDTQEEVWSTTTSTTGIVGTVTSENHVYVMEQDNILTKLDIVDGSEVDVEQYEDAIGNAVSLSIAENNNQIIFGSDQQVITTEMDNISNFESLDGVSGPFGPLPITDTGLNKNGLGAAGGWFSDFDDEYGLALYDESGDQIYSEDDAIFGGGNGDEKYTHVEVSDGNDVAFFGIAGGETIAITHESSSNEIWSVTTGGSGNEVVDIEVAPKSTAE